MDHSKHIPLEIVALSRCEWRICDGRIDEGDARRILGYIERRDDGYEVLALNPAPSVCGCFGSWQESLAALEQYANGRRRPRAVG
ncbi:hypothetical protein [Naasia sp. SYSU D00057]|uniref:hypothetical protein n=1 Tax=Naasia sp. SYSU D00057 TaxID=2817380 RepID=UPI001B317C0E|nr:hypothetical protein [Naasia sp. SYSU D00057]